MKARKIVFRRALCMLLSGAMIGQVQIPVTTAVAAETAELVELLTNGDFSDVNTSANTAANWEFRTEGNTSYSVENGSATYQINMIGGADWVNYLKYTPAVSFTAGQQYTVSVELTSTADRTVRFGFDDGRMYMADDTLKAGETKVVSNTFTATSTGTNHFMLYLGLVDEADAGLVHDVTISNVSITTNAGSGNAGGGQETEPTQPAQNPTDSSLTTEFLTKDAEARSVEGNLIVNGNFNDSSNALASWNIYNTNANFYTADSDNRAVLEINNYAADWQQGLMQTISLDAATGNTYRSITIGLQGGKDRELYYELPVFDADTEVLFSIQMGNVAGDVQRNNIVFKDLLIEVNGYTALAEVLTAEDEPSYVLSGVTSADGYLTNPAGTNGTVTIPNVELAANSAYELSFVSGTRGNAGTVTATVYSSNGTVLAAETYDLAHAADLHTLRVNTVAADNDASVVFSFHGTDGAAYLDSIAMYAEGYASAMGLNISKHDIAPLELNAAPAVSEALVTAGGQTRFPQTGEDVVLTYATNATYQNAIKAVTVNGKQVSYTLGDGTITIPASAFAVPAGAEYEEFDIVVTADWFTDAVVYQNVYNATNWVLSWSDEFDGTTLDLSKWSYQNGTGAEYGVAGWGNNEQQYYTDENVQVKDGKLVITATEGTHGMPYNSGRIWTMSDDRVTPKFAQTYGRFEAKMSLPTGNGIWPAFWMLPAGTVYGGWPLSGELDIMEARGRLTNTVCGTLHYGQSWPNNVYSGLDYYFDEGEDYTPYHIYAVEWEPGEIRWYVDGELYQTQNSWYSTSANEADQFSYPAPFNQDFYIILNLAVGGTFDGNINPDASDLPGEMCVDYVRAYTSTKPLNEFVAEPEIAPADVPAGAKDGFANDGFANINVMKADSDVIDMQHWNLLTLPSYGGAANFSTTKTNGEIVGKIAISNGGSQSYSVQMINMVSLYQGHYYKLSFDAKADAARNIITKIGDDGNPTWGYFLFCGIQSG